MMDWYRILWFVLSVIMVAALVAMPLVMIYWFRYSTEHGLNPAHKAALRTVVETFVLAAESVYRSKAGQEKKQYVLDQIEQFAKRNGVHVDMELIDAMIEAAVYQIINGPKGVKAEEIKTAMQVENAGGNPRSLPFVQGEGPVHEGPPEVHINH